MEITIAHNPNLAIPPFAGTLRRVTAFLGANGAGKSKLLDAVMDAVLAQVGHQNIIRLMPIMDLGDQEFVNSVPVDHAEKQIADHIINTVRQPNNSYRFYIHENQILQALHAIDVEADRAERDAYHRHREDPQGVPYPGRLTSSFDEMCTIFNTVVDVRLSFNRRSGRFEARSTRYASGPYSIDRMSSGEKWIFRALPAFIKFKDRPMVVFVDEPETLLNEQLAVDFWTYIEEQRPNWTFVYATHNISFAGRQSINDLYLLRSPAQNPQRLGHISELTRDDRRALLGIAPRLALSRKALFVEGEDQSIDVPFYRTVLDHNDVLISSVGGSQSVKLATAQTGYWQQLKLEDLTVRGFVDRDFMVLANALPQHVASLALHDLEAYLCLPSLLSKIAAFTAGEKSEQVYADLVIAHCLAVKEATVYKHTDRLFLAADTISVPKSKRTSFSAGMISDSYIARRDELFSGATARYNDAYIRNKVTEVVGKIETALERKDVISLLSWFSGKGLIEKLCEKAMLRDKSHAILMMREHKLVEQVAELKALRAELQGLFD
jgi:ABC-type cobalamin/Fe3+-siderophores transport system ATPase subunit